MKYKKEYFKNEEYERISRKKAINLLKNKNNVTLYCLPINANPNSAWINGFFEVCKESPYTDYIDCINQINEIMYYNCDSELGLYLKFYIKKEMEDKE